jgi:transcriptional regulator with XRE-family HTH domain
MKKNNSAILPLLQRLLNEVGENIRLARLRRRFSASIVADRAGMTRTTLRSIERGDPNVMFGAYARVLLTLGLEKDLVLLAHDDDLGRKLQDAGLPVKARAPKKKKMIEKTREKHE